MPRSELQDCAPMAAIVAGQPVSQYRVLRQEDAWFIKFDGADYGPYQSEREALLFAVDAANKLGEQGKAAEVLVTDETGEIRTFWTFGQDPYPTNL